MIPQDLIGSRPMELDTEQRRQDRDVEILARVIAALILAAPFAAYFIARAA